MPRTPNAIITLLESHPEISLAYLTTQTDPRTIHIHTSTAHPRPSITLPHALQAFQIEIHPQSTFNILRAPPLFARDTSPQQACQNEPIQLGCQIQPEAADWVGTAGAPVAFWIRPEEPAWGILSNWHVIADGMERQGRRIFQPDDTHATIAHLLDWAGPDPSKPSELDAAIANADIDGFHSIDWKILGIGTPSPNSVAAAPGVAAIKTGRTTGTTEAICTAIGAAAKVGYGNFLATMTGLDVFTDAKTRFSAPGDSGSLILAKACLCPMSLLFAGGGKITLGIPARTIENRFNLRFSP